MNEPSEAGANQVASDPGDAMDQRRQLINVAYRLLGSLADAEDVVQESYTRWFALPVKQRDTIEVPAAWLTTVVSRICLDVLGSARVRRESYVGQWLPEPLPDHEEGSGSPSGSGGAGPADRVTLDESITMAFLVVLESMTPAERVAFILHDVFRYPFSEVAEILGRSPAASRQLATSARRRVRASRAPSPGEPQQAQLVHAFMQAWEAKDIGALIDLLDPDAQATGDGGGLVTAEPEPVTGRKRVAQYFADLVSRPPEVTLVERTVNGRPGLVALHRGTVVTVLAFGMAEGRIKDIWAVRNPEKLRSWTTRHVDGVWRPRYGV